jgi:hypothetical protein
MTSTSIYTPITPTYLYIKQHSITKKKYFGKTTKTNPYTYNGSGTYWLKHINKHGKEHIVTLWVSDLYYDTSIIEIALQFSADNDIVKSKEWANQIPENGLHGGSVKDRKCTDETKAKMSDSHKNKRLTEETKAKLRKPKSEEHKANLRKPKSQSPKRKPHPQITCPHCGKTGGANNMKRYHFDNCKLMIISMHVSVVL